MNWVVFWTWRKHRVFKYRYEAERHIKTWKRWYQRKGWLVQGSAKDGYIAMPPDMSLEDYFKPGTIHAIGLRKVPDELMDQIQTD